MREDRMPSIAIQLKRCIKVYTTFPLSTRS